MSRNIQFLIFLLCLFFTSVGINGQNRGCNPDLTAEPAYDCATAAASAVNGSGTGFVCDLDQFCINTSSVPVLIPPVPFCTGGSVLNNPIWFSFIADASGVLDIVVKTNDCSGGFQWALYDQCGAYFSAIACQSNPVLPPNQPFFIYANVTPGATYYLVIDGANGATCSFEFNVFDGISPVPVGEPLGTSLSGSTNVCPGATISYSFAGIEQATDYVWTLPDGFSIESEGPSVNFTFPETMAAGTYELCVKGKNDCDENDDSTPICWQIIVGDEPKIDVSAQVCQGDTYTFKNTPYGPGYYEIKVAGPGTSSCDTTYNLTVNQHPPSPTVDVQVYKCPEQSFANIDGTDYPGGTSALVVTYTNDRGCDSLVNYFINDIEITGNVVAQPASLPCGGTSSSTLSVSAFFNIPPDANGVSYIWYNDQNVIIGNQDVVGVTDPGVYTVEVIVTKDNPANVIPDPVTCSKSFNVTVIAENSTLTEPITAGPTVLCAGENYIFTTNSQSGTTSYTWNHEDGTVVSGGTNETIELTYDEPGLYNICVNAVDGCGPGPDDCFQIQVVPSPKVALEANYSICALGDELTATITDVPNASDPLLQYLWTVTSGPDIPGVVFTPANNPVTQVTVVQPGTYTFQLQADYNGQQCGEFKTIEVTFEKELVLTADDIQVCNDLLQPLPSVVDLDTLLTNNGVAFTGSWTFESGPGSPAGTLPVQDFTGLTQTGIYTYKFTPVQTGVCVVPPVVIEIDMQNCICPPLSINPIGGNVCNDGGTVNLNTSVQGGTGPGSWTVTNEPSGSTVAVAGGSVNFANQPAGSYIFTFTLSSSMAGCPSTATTTVTVNAAPEATLKTVDKACNSDFSPTYINEVDFDTLVLSGLTTGVWTYSGSGVDPGSASFHPKDFNGAAPGTYQYTYTVTGDPTCAPVAYTISIIVEDCKCPSVAISPAESFCNNTPQINLDNYKVTLKPGAWSIQSGPAGSTASITGGNLLSATGSPFGTYVLVYKIDEIVPVGCSDTSQLIITLDSLAFAGSNASVSLCDDFGSGVDLDTVLTLQQAGGTWAYTGSTDIGSSFNAATGTINFNNLPQGLGYTFNYTVASPMGLCPSSTSTVTVNKNVLPTSDAGTDAFIDCVTTSVNLGGSNTSGGGGYSYEWSEVQGGTILGTEAILPGIQDAGTYELQVTNTTTGCTQTDLVEVTKDNAAISAINYEVDSISCYNKADGSISILNITGGTPVFEYAIDGGAFSSTVDFNNLGPGIHKIEVTDVNGCHYEQVINLENPEEVRIELGTNKVIAEGDVVTISPDLTIDVNAGTIVWSSNPAGTSCNNCETLTESPLFTTTYIATVTSDNGCSATDSIEVRVKSVIRVFIPNAISPNNDGVNDVFYVQSDPNVVAVKSLAVYNRWGDVQFSIKDTPPNDPAYGWNGRFGEQRQNSPSVFVYHALLQLRDGREVVYKGDVTVIK